MMRFLSFGALVGALLALAPACPPPSPPLPPEPDVVVVDAAPPAAVDAAPIPFDAGPVIADVYSLGCANLALLNCKEGMASNCASAFRRRDRVDVALNMQCVVNARDQPTVRACAPAWKKACAPPGG